jgi:hypothetical protein
VRTVCRGQVDGRHRTAAGSEIPSDLASHPPVKTPARRWRSAAVRASSSCIRTCLMWTLRRGDTAPRHGIGRELSEDIRVSADQPFKRVVGRQVG